MKKALAMFSLVAVLVSMFSILTVVPLSALALKDDPLVDPTMSNLVTHSGWTEYTTWVAWSNDAAAVAPTHETVSGVPSGTTTAVKWTGNANRSIIWTVLTGDKQPAAGDYVFSASVKLDGVENEGSDLRGFTMWVYDNPSVFLDGGAELAKTSFLSGTADWQTISLPVTVGNNKIALAFEIMSAPGTAYITDVKLEPVSGAGDGGDNIEEDVPLLDSTMSNLVAHSSWTKYNTWVMWTSDGTTTTTHETVDDVPSGTTEALKWTTVNSARTLIWVNLEEDKPAPGDYIFSASVKMDDLTRVPNTPGNGLTMWVSTPSGGDPGEAGKEIARLSNDYYGTSDWQTISLPVTIGESGIALVFEIMSSVGSVYITDVKLEKAPLIADPTFTTLKGATWSKSTNWEYWSNQATTYSREAVTDVPSGTAYALKMVAPDVVGTRALVWTHLFGNKRPAAGDYILSASIKMDGVVRDEANNLDHGLKMWVSTPSGGDPGENIFAKSESLAGSSDWQTVTVPVTVETADIALAFDLFCSHGTVYITDVKLTPADEYVEEDPAVKQVESALAALPTTVTPGDGAAIEAAAAAYAALSADQQAQVSNAALLTAAEDAFNAFRPTMLGAQYRVTGATGVRFGGSVVGKATDAYKGYELVGYGMVYAKQANWTGGALVRDAAYAKYQEGTAQLPVEGDTLIFYGTITNIPAEAADTALMGRAYLIYQKDEETVYVYSTENSDMNEESTASMAWIRSLNLVMAKANEG